MTVQVVVKGVLDLVSLVSQSILFFLFVDFFLNQQKREK